MLKQMSRIVLGDDLSFEIKPAGVPEKLMVRPGEAVDASVFAAAVGVDGPVEGDIGRGDDVIDNGARMVGDHFDGDVDWRGVGTDGPFIRSALDPLTFAFFAQDVEADLLETIAGIEPRAASPRRAVH